MTKLSVLLVIHNEEDRLSNCLSHLGFADELVIVLDKCTDQSQSIAESFGAVITQGAWDIEGDRRNVGLELCSGDWILEVDADEEVSQELAIEIKEFLQTSPEPGYALLPFDNYVGERLVRHGWGANWGVSAAPRLSARGCKKWGRQRIHPALELSGKRYGLNARIRHYVDRDISDMIKRLDSYSSAKARDLRENPDGVGYARNIRRFFTRFYKCYVTRKGYLEGQYGFLIALMAGLYPILSYLKAQLEEK